MGKLSSLTLGIITAVGGFIDMGELVTCSQAGAQYRYALLWTIVVGTLGIIVEANFKLQPLPAAERTLLLSFANASDAMQMVIALLGSRLLYTSDAADDPLCVDSGARRTITPTATNNRQTTICRRSRRPPSTIFTTHKPDQP